MSRILITPEELEFVTDNREHHFLSYEDYPELATLYEQAAEVVNRFRTPEQKKTDDIIALAISTDPDSAAELIPDWAPWTGYRIGEHLTFDGSIYRVVQSHRSQHDWRPPEVPALYTLAGKTTTDPVGDDYPEWIQPIGGHDAYNTGDRVTFEGQIWESLMDGNVWSPIEYPTAWTLVRP